MSSNLQRLAKDMPAYNSLLNDLQESIKSIKNTDYPATPELVLKDFNEKTGTYDQAYIYVHADSWDSHEAYRIVQPGNTLSQIATDSYNQKVADNDGNPLGYSRSDFQGFIVEKNGIEDPNMIKVGQTLKMYVF
ncbi:MAG: LysM peptidoglycan-binding domain-containing protein [Cyanobacteria bacterium]|nr:LysM peptidoglycan-binding domain-containing protein [Cyanobacteriota bacterium]